MKAAASHPSTPLRTSRTPNKAIANLIPEGADLLPLSSLLIQRR